jgi:hypothetical protein
MELSYAKLQLLLCQSGEGNGLFYCGAGPKRLSTRISGTVLRESLSCFVLVSPILSGVNDFYQVGKESMTLPAKTTWIELVPE